MSPEQLEAILRLKKRAEAAEAALVEARQKIADLYFALSVSEPAREEKP